MARVALREHLDALRERTQEMGGLVEQAVAQTAQALACDDTALPGAVISTNRQIRALSAALTEQCLLIIATQQPLASDLRLVMATLSIAADLARIGSHTRGIARLTRKMRRDAPETALPAAVVTMAQRVAELLEVALRTFLAHDAERAQVLLITDQEIDAAYGAFAGELLGAMAARPEMLNEGMILLKIAHKLERIGDRVSNIIERTIWMNTAAPVVRPEHVSGPRTILAARPENP